MPAPPSKNGPSSRGGAPATQKGKPTKHTKPGPLQGAVKEAPRGDSGKALQNLQKEMQKEILSTEPTPTSTSGVNAHRRPSAPAVIATAGTERKVAGHHQLFQSEGSGDHPHQHRPRSEYSNPPPSGTSSEVLFPQRCSQFSTVSDKRDSDRMMSYGEQVLEQWLSVQDGSEEEFSNLDPKSHAAQVEKALAAEMWNEKRHSSSVTTVESPDLDRPQSARSPQSRSTTSQMMSTMIGMRNSSNQLRRAELSWVEAPEQILIIKKPGDPEVHASVRIMCEFLLRTRPGILLRMQAEEFDKGFPFPGLEKKYGDRIQPWSPAACPDEDLSATDLVPAVDLVITVGGDGTLLYTSSLFQLMAPPMMSFAMGSLGFLTPFDFKEHEKHINQALDGRSIVTLRTRLECEIIEDARFGAQDTQHPDDNSIEGLVHNTSASAPPRQPHRKFRTNCLNEVVIDRGPLSYLSAVDIFCDGRHVTCVQGDGVIISTPTGSTAYSLAAGGSMVHPTVPCIAITPICPHSLSFRPLILPATVELVVRVSPTGRGSAWVSMDGKNRQELVKGNDLRVTTSVWPVPTLNTADSSADWFEALVESLNWNQRKQQKPM
eukprot:m.170150 g.170150  ORF g.170150 m.170150 type:complete len:602 (+) comp13204_c0_seq1:161-1966(+)